MPDPVSSKPTTFDVFISYSNVDTAIAHKACAALEGAKVKCWIAPRDIVPGVTWSAAIVEAMLEMDLGGYLRNKFDQAKNGLRRAEDVHYDVTLRRG